MSLMRRHASGTVTTMLANAYPHSERRLMCPSAACRLSNKRLVEEVSAPCEAEWVGDLAPSFEPAENNEWDALPASENDVAFLWKGQTSLIHVRLQR